MQQVLYVNLYELPFMEVRPDDVTNQSPGRIIAACENGTNTICLNSLFTFKTYEIKAIERATAGIITHETLHAILNQICETTSSWLCRLDKNGEISNLS